MQQIILLFHILFAIALIAVIMIQQGKGAGMGASFGSGASQTVFGSQGSSGFLLKLTGGLGILFFATSLLLSFIAARESRMLNQVNTLKAAAQISQYEQPVSAPAAVKPVAVTKAPAVAPAAATTAVTTSTPTATNSVTPAPVATSAAPSTAAPISATVTTSSITPASTASTPVPAPAAITAQPATPTVQQTAPITGPV